MEIKHVMDGQARIDRLMAEPVARAWYVYHEEPMVFLLTEAGALFGGYEGLADEVIQIEGDWRRASHQELLNAIADYVGGIVMIHEIRPAAVRMLQACMN